MENSSVDLIKSWACEEGNANTIDQILEWISIRNAAIEVDIRKTELSRDTFWFYDEEKGIIRNRDNTFFTIEGYVEYDEENIKKQQPIIVQDEIGYLGIICKKIDGILNFLMQAKIEPGNINKIQISPTIQATKSNFTQRHGGKRPKYMEYFWHGSNYNIIVDQIQSEQASRFYKKRNRNILIQIPEDDPLEEGADHRWMTLGQIKRLMGIDNIVNMDTRTVLSCIPYNMEALSAEDLEEIHSCFKDRSLFSSIYGERINLLPQIYHEINDYKMFSNKEGKLTRLDELENWSITPQSIICKDRYPFKVIFCDVTIEGREVKHWMQPLLEAEGRAFFGLFTRIKSGKREFLVKAMPEIGAFDKVELGPSVQLESIYNESELQEIDRIFLERYRLGDGVIKNALLSEEGGRFYHEENYNVIIDVGEEAFIPLPKGYFWLDYLTLNTLVQINNCMNIQLRNLLSLLDI